MATRPSQKLVGWLEEQIRSLPPGARLPTDPQLAATFGVSEVTVSRILRTYRDRGLVTRIPGRGTFIAGSEGGAPAQPKPPRSSAENIAEHILQSLHSGMLRRGQALPPVKQVVYRFRVSPASVRRAYAMLEERGLVTRIGRTFWAGGFTEAMRPARTRVAVLFKQDSSDFAAVFRDAELGQAYQRMERELIAQGFRLDFENTADFDKLLRRWRARRRLPAGFVFHGVREGRYEQLRARLSKIRRLAEPSGPSGPRIVVDWHAGDMKPRIGGVQILSRGNLSTITARILAQHLVRTGCKGASFFTNAARLQTAVVAKIRAEIKHLAPGFVFRMVVPGACGANAKRRIERRLRRDVQATQFMVQVLSKYGPVRVEEFEAEMVIVADHREAYDRSPRARTWVFQRDPEAATALSWAKETGLNVPSDLAIISQERSPNYYHLGLTCCFPDYEQIGYQMAHAVIGDFPVAQTSKGFIRTNGLVVEKRTTRCRAG